MVQRVYKQKIRQTTLAVTNDKALCNRSIIKMSCYTRQLILHILNLLLTLKMTAEKYLSMPSNIQDNIMSVSLQFLPERDYVMYVRVFAIANPSVICRLSVICNVRPPYSGGWKFRQYFFVIFLWPPCKILQRSSQGNPSVGGGGLSARRIAKCHVREYIISW